LRMCAHFAPGKPVIAFLMARVHPSADETMPYLSGAYWRSFMEKVKSAGYDGLVVYQNTTDPDPLSVTPRPDWYLETEAFRAAPCTYPYPTEAFAAPPCTYPYPTEAFRAPPCTYPYPTEAFAAPPCWYPYPSEAFRGGGRSYPRLFGC
jgi:hypothetical protein